MKSLNLKVLVNYHAKGCVIRKIQFLLTLSNERSYSEFDTENLVLFLIGVFKRKMKTFQSCKHQTISMLHATGRIIMKVNKQRLPKTGTHIFLFKALPGLEEKKENQI